MQRQAKSGSVPLMTLSLICHPSLTEISNSPNSDACHLLRGGQAASVSFSLKKCYQRGPVVSDANGIELHGSACSKPAIILVYLCCIRD